MGSKVRIIDPVENFGNNFFLCDSCLCVCIVGEIMSLKERIHTYYTSIEIYVK